MTLDTQRILGFSETQPSSPVAMLDRLSAGFPVEMLDAVARAVAPGDPAFKYRIVAKSTLARRRHQDEDRLTPEESERLARLADVWDFACDVWKSDDAAREFLFRKHPLLEMRVPMDAVLQADFGARLVRNILGGLKYGTAV